MVYEYVLYDMDLNYIETVYMTEEEFIAYSRNHKTLYEYKKFKASENFQK